VQYSIFKLFFCDYRPKIELSIAASKCVSRRIACAKWKGHEDKPTGVRGNGTDTIITASAAAAGVRVCVVVLL